MATRKKFDLHAPGAKELADRIVHGAFVTQGTMIAFPTCFPGVTVPLAADQSRITALDVTADGIVYAATSGTAAHLLVGMFHGVTGMVFDMGAVQGATQSAAICCGQQRLVAAVNGPAGGHLVTRELERLPFDLIQEWHISRKPLQVLGPVCGQERILHMVADSSRRWAVGVTEKHLFSFDFTSSSIDIVAELPGRGRLVRSPAGDVLGPDTDATLWRYTPQSRKLKRHALKLPAPAQSPAQSPARSWGQPTLMWATDTLGARLYLADADGRLFSFTEQDGFSQELARTPVAPVGPMAVTFDGRLFGVYGEGMAKLFCFDPQTQTLTSLGVAVSVFERRRYGYAFGDAVVGRDGEIVLGEDDDLGHLWLYFPRIGRPASPAAS